MEMIYLLIWKQLAIQHCENIIFNLLRFLLPTMFHITIPTKLLFFWWQNLLYARITLHFPLITLKRNYQLYSPHSFYHHWSCVALFCFDFLVCLLSLIHSIYAHGPFFFSQRVNHSKMVIFCLVSGWGIKNRVRIKPTAITHMDDYSVCLEYCMGCSCTKRITYA